MAEVLDRKLNRLQHELPEGFLADAAWMEAHGYSSSLRSHYVKAGWLQQPARRVYSRSGRPLTWQQVVVSLQVLLDYPLTVGGRTALDELGYSHYLTPSLREVHLYGPFRPPTWLDELPLDAKFVWHNSRRLFRSEDVPENPRRSHHDDTPGAMPGGFMVQAGGRVTWPIRYSSRERAVLELLDELPERESFHQVDMLMEGAANLSPRALQGLLEACTNVKVKRLFFFFADRHNHAWLAHLDKSQVDLGSGKRVLAKGGKLDTHYQITVPADLHGVS